MAKKEQQIQIIADDNGNKIRVSANNPEYAHVRLVQEKIWIAPSGWVRKRNMSTLLHGKLEDLQDLGINKMKYLPGQIIIKEQCHPFNEGNPDRDLKYAGDTGVICCRDGEPIYRTTIYDASSTDTDVLVAHTNGDAIREANSFASATSDDTTSMISGENFFKANDAQEHDPAQTNIIDTIAEVEKENSESGMTTSTSDYIGISDDENNDFHQAAETEEVVEEEETEVEEIVEEEEVEEPASFNL
jgi:hypothetical protein